MDVPDGYHLNQDLFDLLELDCSTNRHMVEGLAGGKAACGLMRRKHSKHRYGSFDENRI